MKICFQCSELAEGNAIGNITISLIENLIDENEVHVVTKSFDTGSQRIKKLAEKSLRIHRINPLKFTSVLEFISTHRTVTKKTRELDAEEKFDVIHCMNIGTYSDIFHAESCHKAWIDEKKKKSLIYRILVNFHPLTAATLFYDEKIIRNKKIKKIIACSNQVKNDLVKYYSLDPGMIEVVYNGVNKDNFSITEEERNRLREKIRKENSTGDKTLLLFIGHAFEKKGLAEVIEATAGMNAKLLVIGGDKPEKFQRLAERKGVDIVFAGPKKTINDYLLAADIFVFPTKHEPFGMVITEAMAAGLPVITSRDAGAAEITTDGKDCVLLRNPEDVEELREKLTLLIRDKNLREHLGNEARKTAVSMDWKNVAAEITGIYRSIAK